jgi:cysteinyl-tRNA synthetase
MFSIYNTLTKSKQEFVPLNPGKVGMYTCGPTVYDYLHIGNIRAYLTADILRRYLEYSGYQVRMIKNVTDVGHLTDDDVAQGDSGEDKIERKALAEKKTPTEIAEFYEKYFKQAEKKMNILPAHYFPRATAHVPQMIKMIETLIAKGFAYEKNGNVFYDVTKFPEYGKLSGNTLENLKVGARLEEHPDKKNPWDFALWLKAPENHLLKWQSPWSIGYPGWHIECSAMSMEYLGNTLDIHTGAEDGIFPHHEAEIAQSEGCSGQTYSRYWVHLRYLQVDGKKMSKSKGNFYKLEDVKERGFSAMDLRLFFLSAHYRTPVNFTWDALTQAHKNLQRINDFVLNLEAISSRSSISLAAGFDMRKLDEFRDKFESAMDDDMNTPLALSELYEFITEFNKSVDSNGIGPDEAKSILALWNRTNKVFGFELKGQAEIPEEIMRLIKQREDARKGKDFSKSDELRALIEKKGYVVKDTKDGQEVKPAD